MPDELVKVTANDQVASYLTGKLKAGEHGTQEVQQPGRAELFVLDFFTKEINWFRKAGRYYSLPSVSQTASITISPDVVYCIPFLTPMETSFDRMAVKVKAGA